MGPRMPCPDARQACSGRRGTGERSATGPASGPVASCQRRNGPDAATPANLTSIKAPGTSRTQTALTLRPEHGHEPGQRQGLHRYRRRARHRPRLRRAAGGRISEEEWDRVQAVNVKGVLFCSKHAIPHMRRAGHGSIIHLSSIYGLVGAPDVPAYHASKGAVRLMAKTDAMIYAPDRIRVNSVHPGYIWTPMVENHLKASGATDLDAARAEVGRLHPLGHMGEPDDIAWGVVYLASDESKFVTGAELVIDGGYTAR
ncbi:SDR family oxidoreductase [Arenimonas fontis]|uniref:SDR family oxidoreductase n=1 Tax=Arenimonas fontis TaxID=2608255 RepID=UPI003CCC7DAC